MVDAGAMTAGHLGYLGNFGFLVPELHAVTFPLTNPVQIIHFEILSF